MSFNKTVLFLCSICLIFPFGCSTRTKTPATNPISDPSTKKVTDRESAYLSCLDEAKKHTSDPFDVVDLMRNCMREKGYALKGPTLSRDYTDSKGCPRDTDCDGIPDYRDECPETPKGVKVDPRGCPPDTDGDGVPDHRDECPGTPRNVKVDERGCPLDTDGDGVPDYRDRCPATPRDLKVDEAGCPFPLDTDSDGVPDAKDICPGTPKGAWVDERGCWVIPDPLFDFDKYEIKPRYYAVLDKVVMVLKRNPSLNIEIQGHTCDMGTVPYNQRLSENRARAVMNYLKKKGIEGQRVSAVGYGELKPKASNKTEAGRELNRRVELHPVR